MSVADAEDPDVRIEIEAVYKDSSNIESRLQSLQERIGTTNKEVNELERRFRSLNDGLAAAKQGGTGAASAIGAAGDAARQSGNDADGASKEWRELAKAMAEAKTQYKAFRREQITGADEGPTLNPKSMQLGSLRDDVNVFDAQRASYESEARGITGAVDKHKASAQSQELAAALEKERQQYGRLTVAQRLAREATQELAAARRQLDSALKSGNGQELASGWKRYDQALKGATSASRELAGAEKERSQAAASQNRLYQQYMEGQARADKAKLAAAEQQDRYYNDYLATQRKAQQGAAESIGSSKAAVATQRQRVEIDQLTRSHGALYVAERHAAEAAEQLGRAQRTLDGATKTGDIHAQAKAWDGVAAAERRAADATINMNRELDRQRGALEHNTDALPRLRYALYDVATTYGILSAAILAASTLTVKTAADFESSFTSVERTFDGGGAAVGAFREQLVDLSTEIPKTFAELSQIATLGNQLGVPAADLEQFTQVVAQFSTVSGMTVEATAQAFGRLSNILGLPISEAVRLGSAIELVGVRSAATDEQIIALTERLGASGHRAGFTADQIVGLAGALGSLGVAPERAQGVFETYFNSLNEGLAEGGKKAEAFALITGRSIESLNDAVRSGQGFTVFKEFLAGLQGADTVQLTEALDLLGLSGLRANEVVGRISQNLPLLQRAFNDAAQGYGEGTELGRQYAMVLDDLNSQMQLLGNALKALADAGAADLLPGLADAVGVLVKMVNATREFVETPIGGVLANIAIGLAVAIGLWFAYSAATALATASTAALITAQKELDANKWAGGIRGLIQAMLGLNTANLAAAGSTAAVGTSAATASGGVALLARAFQFLGKATVVLAVIGLAIGLITDLRGTVLGAIDVVEWLGSTWLGWTNPLRLIMGLLGGVNAAMGRSASAGQTLVSAFSVIGSLFNAIVAPIRNAVNGFFQWGSGVIGAVQSTARALPGPLKAIVDMVLRTANAVGTVLGPLGEGIRNVVKGIGKGFSEFDNLAAKGFDSARDWAKTLPSMYDDFGALDDAVMGAANAFDFGAGAGDGFTDSLGSLDDAAAGATEQLRTLQDYANDLSGVFDRSFDIRFGDDQALDAIASSWNKLKADQEQATESLKEYHNTLAALTADKRVQEFWLTVAEGYGDTLRADKIRAELAETNAKIAKTTKDAAKAQEVLSGTTEGNSDTAIANRAALYGLAEQYQALLVQYAESGMSQADLQVKAAELKAEFMRQAQQLGYTGEAVVEIGRHFDDLITIIAAVPRNVDIDVNANTNPAELALREFIARARQMASTAGVNIPVSSSFNSSGIVAALEGEIALREAKRDAARAERLFAAANEQQQAIYALYAKLSQIRGYRSGGYTGGGSPSDAAGIVHKREFVFDEGPTSKWGVATLDAMRSADNSTVAAVKALLGVSGSAFSASPRPAPRVTVTSSNGGGWDPSVLHPIYDMLGQIRDAVGLEITGDTLTDVAGAGYITSGRRGSA